MKHATGRLGAVERAGGRAEAMEAAAKLHSGEPSGQMEGGPAPGRGLATGRDD